MSDAFLKVKDLRTRQTEFMSAQLKSERSNLINSKRTFFAKTKETGEDTRTAAFYQNVPNKEEISAIVATAANEAPEPHNFRKFMAELRDSDIKVVTRALVKIRVIYTKVEGNFNDELIGYDGITPILDFLQNFMYPHLQAEAAWIVSNVSAGSSDDTHALMNKGVLGALQKGLHCPFEEVVLHLLYVLGNISADCLFCRNQVVSTGLVGDIQALPPKFPNPLVNTKIIWILSNILRLQPESEPLSDASLAIFQRLIAEFIETQEFEVQNDCIFGISKHVNLRSAELLMQEDFLAKLRQFHEDLLGQKISHNIGLIGAIHDIISGLSLCQDSYIMDLIRFGFLRNLHMTLCCQKIAFVIDALVILSNFVVGTDTQISAVLAEPGLVDRIISLSHSSKDPRVQKNAVWVLANMCSTTSRENVQHLLNYGLLDLFSDRLRMDEEAATLINVIEGMERLAEFFHRLTPNGENQFVKMIDENGISLKLESLQNHKSEKVYAKVLTFLEKYLEMEESD